MKKLLILILCYSLQSFAQEKRVNVKYFNTLPNISIRALEVLNDSTVWFAANNGVWGYTEDAGKNWKIDSLTFEGKSPQFRSIAVLDTQTVLLLSIASPALLYRTSDKGKSWKIVYTNTNKDIFFDCMKFKDSKTGFAVGDAINNCIPLIRTDDAGATWKEMACDQSGQFKNESFFASSNSNISFVDDNMYIGSGGMQSRILKYSIKKNQYKIISSPLPQGEKMTGIYAIQFHDKKIAGIVGGNYDKAEPNIPSIAITKNAGKTWQIIKTPRPYFGASIAFKSKNKFYVTSHLGTMKCDIKKKTSKEVVDLEGNPIKFHTIKISPSEKTIWMAGSNGRIGKIEL